MTKILTFLMILFLLGSCASALMGPTYSEFSTSISNLSPNNGRIYVYRNSSIPFFFIQPKVKLNGEVVGQTIPNGFFYVDKEPGNYEIMTKTEVTRTLYFTLDKGQTCFVRMSISLGAIIGHIYPELVEPKVGENEIKNCIYIGQQK